MSTFRGFDVYLISRVSRANSHYLDADTLRWFNAYGGTHARLSDELTYVVESVEHPSLGRVYRVVEFRFYQNEDNRERVNVERVTDFLSRGQANRELSRIVREFRAAHQSQNGA